MTIVFPSSGHQQIILYIFVLKNYKRNFFEHLTSINDSLASLRTPTSPRNMQTKLLSNDCVETTLSTDDVRAKTVRHGGVVIQLK